MSLDESTLVDLVQGYPNLWDKKNILYKDNIASENSWKTISEIMHITVEDCQSLWASIRNRYIKERKIIKTLPTGTAKYICKWPLFDQCGFLDKVIAHRKTKSNILTKKPDLANVTKSAWTTTLVIDDEGNCISQEIDNEPEQNGAEEDFDDVLVSNTGDGDNEYPDSPIPSTSSITPVRLYKPVSEPVSTSVSADWFLLTVGKINKLRSERNKTPKRKRGEPDISEDLSASCNTISKSLETFLMQAKGDDKDSCLPEDYHFAISLAQSLSKIKNEKQKLLLKAKLLVTVADEEDS